MTIKLLPKSRLYVCGMGNDMGFTDVKKRILDYFRKKENGVMNKNIKENRS